MSDLQTVSPNLSSSTGSSSTPDSFLYETKFIVLSFLNHLTQDKQHKPSTQTQSDQTVRQCAQKWKTRSLPSSPPKHRKKLKKLQSQTNRRPFSSDESLHLHLQSSAPAPSTSNQRTEISKSQQTAHTSRKSKKQILGGRHSDPLQSSCANSPDSSKAGSSLSSRIAAYHRSVSDGSSQDGGSYVSDADDELDTSQGSNTSSLRGSRSSDFLRASGHHLQVSRLSTVASESEAEPELQDSKILTGADDDVLPIAVEDIEFDIGGSPEDKHHPTFSQRSTFQNGVAESASFDNHKLHDVEDVVDGLDEGETDSDVSDLDSEENAGAKGDDEDEGKLDEAAGGAVEPGRDVSCGTTRPGTGTPSRSHLFLDLTMAVQPNLRREDVDFVMVSLREEIQEEMLSLESEVEDARRSQRFNSQTSLCIAPIPAPLTPQSEAAEILARIGDDIVRNHDVMPRVESAVGRLFTQESGSLTYEVFREVAKSIVDESAPGWRQVALLLVYSQSVALKLVTAGGQNVSNIVDYSVRLLADLTADFIVQQGGWSGLITTESSSSCMTSPEPNMHQVNPLHTAQTQAQTQTMHCEATAVPTHEDLIQSQMDGHSETLNNTKDVKANGDTRNNDSLDSGSQDSSSPSNSGSASERGDNSPRSTLSWILGADGQSSFVTKCSAALALLSIGIGVAMVYIKR